MDVFLIRHGETEFNKQHRIQGRKIDAPLNEVGWKQANSVAEALSHYTIDVVVASSLMRTHQTSIPLLKSSVLFEKHASLDEMSFGEIEGKDFYEIRQQIVQIHEQWSSGNVDFKIAGGESPLEVLDRSSKQVHEVLNKYQGKTIVFVLHGRLIRILLSEWLGYGLENMHKIEHANGSINHLKWDGTFFKAVQLNKIDHLDHLSNGN